MKAVDIASRRLQNQQLSSPRFEKPKEVVEWFGAVQCQDYYGAKWALGLRMSNAADESIEDAFARGEILRTHVMRPTWHFVSAVDLGWMLKLTGDRVNAANNYYYRKFELDSSVFKRTHKALVNALRGDTERAQSCAQSSRRRVFRLRTQSVWCTFFPERNLMV